MPLPCRKRTRLNNFDYNSTGAYFITLCTKDRRCILSRVVGTGVPDGPLVQLTKYGKIADKYINSMNDYYKHITVEKYVIMPNHIHLLLRIPDLRGGPSGTPVPTVQNSAISKFVSSLKRFCNKEYGENIWQSRSYDHIIRGYEDYIETIRYIHENPIKWYYDELYIEN